MFTGLIEEVGTVVAFRADGEAKRLEIAAPQLAGGTRVGDSVAVNGCCLTIASRDGNQLTFDVLQESLDRTNLENLQPESRVNLELALTVGAALGGHFVQGHVDCAAPILALRKMGEVTPDGADAHVDPNDIDSLLEAVKTLMPGSTDATIAG